MCHVIGVGQVMVRDSNQTSERLVQVKRSPLPSHFLLQLAEISEDAPTSAEAWISCSKSATSASASMAPSDQLLPPLAMRAVSNPVRAAPGNAKAGDAKAGEAKGGGQPGQRGLCAICGKERGSASFRKRTSELLHLRPSPFVAVCYLSCVGHRVFTLHRNP
jgi:hypothetical protein